MASYFLEVSGILGAYFLGSVPVSVWVGKLFYGIDIREFGSGNAGATNMFRVLGKKAGIPVLILDIAKGYLAVLISLLVHLDKNSIPFYNFQVALGIASVLGHLFPILAGFRGGKGVATLLGVSLAIVPQVAAIVLLVFLVTLLVSKYVSLSSMLAGLSFPVVLISFFPSDAMSVHIFSMTVAFMLLVTHKKNIKRLWLRQETKMILFKKTKG